MHAYDQAEVIAGQGTVGREFEADAPDLTHVLVAVGGGGLIGGIASWYAGRTAVVAVEPALCPCLHDALAAGEPRPAPVGGVAADSLGARQVGALVLPIARRFVAESVLVSDDAIRAAQAALWDTLRLVVEPGGATAFAALLSGAWAPPAGALIGVVVCGANADPATVTHPVSRETGWADGPSRPGQPDREPGSQHPAGRVLPVLGGDLSLQRLDDLPADRQTKA